MLKLSFFIILSGIILSFSFVEKAFADEEINYSRLNKHCSIHIKTVAISKSHMKMWLYKGINNDYYDIIKEYGIKNDKAISENRFQTFPIKYFIHPYSDSWKADIKEAIKDYSLYFPIVEVTDFKGADLIISFMDGDSYDKSGFYPSLGLTTSKYINNKYRSLIVFPDIHYPPGLRKRVVIHELGHAFGIQEHSDNEADIMYSKFDPQLQKGLSERDLNTLLRIYEY